MAHYPPGYRFCPTDEELITYYLRRKANSQELPCDIVTDVDFYKYHPAELADKYKCENNTWYFFTPRKRKYQYGSRPDRAAGPGYWKATIANQKIMDPKDKASIIGGKTALVYYEGKPGNKNGTKGKQVNENRRKTNWIMHEYTIKEFQRGDNNKCEEIRKPDMKLDDWVLSKIYHRAPCKGKQAANGPLELDLDIDEEINALMVSDDDDYVDLTQPGPSNVWCPPMQLNGLENGNNLFFNQVQPEPSNHGSLPIQPNGLGYINDEFIDQTQPWFSYPSYPTMQPLPYQAQPEPFNLGCPPMQPSELNESSTFLAMSQPDPMNLAGLSAFMENEGSLLQPTGVLPSDRFEGMQQLMQSSPEMDHLANCYQPISNHFDCLRPVPPPVMSPQQQSSFNEALLQWDLNVHRPLPVKPNSNQSHLNI